MGCLILDDLTNDAKFLLSEMYADYISRRKNGTPKQEAVKFKSAQSIHESIMKDWSLEDTTFTCKELLDSGLITATFIDGYIFTNIHLTTIAIAKMESKFKDKVDEVLDYAGKVKSLIPFI